MLRQPIFILLIALVLVACGPDSSRDKPSVSPEQSKPLVIASNYPLYYFARQIAGESITVEWDDGTTANCGFALDVTYDAQGGTNLQTRLEAFMFQARQFQAAHGLTHS